jgi:DNA polymerase I
MQAELVGVSLAIQDNVLSPGSTDIRAAYIPLTHKTGVGDLLGGGHADGQIPMKEALAALKGLLEDPSVLKVAQNLKYDYLVMKRHGIVMQAFDDTMLMSYVLDAGKGNHGMDGLSEKWLGHTPIAYKDVAGSGKSSVTFDLVDIDRATAYAAEDADVTLRLWLVLKPRLAAEGLTRIYERLERPLVPVLAHMEERGITVDRQILSRLSGEFAQKAAAPRTRSTNSPASVSTSARRSSSATSCSARWACPAAPRPRPASGPPPPRCSKNSPPRAHAAAPIVDWRQLTKLKSTYTDALPEYIHPRPSASTPPMRWPPRRPAASHRRSRTCRTSRSAPPKAARSAPPSSRRSGPQAVSADYSQIELRVLAHVADIPQLRQAFADGIDIHAMTASEMFGVPVEGMPSEVRRRAKAINFGIIYGISAFGLANQLSIERSEAGDYIKKYFERFPGIKDYMESTKAFAREHGYVETIFGRRAHYPEIKSSNPSMRAFNERAAINAPIQGSAADVIRRAMIQIEPRARRSGSVALSACCCRCMTN